MATNGSLLFVDSETSMLESIKRFVMDLDHEAHFAEDNASALEIVKNNDIDVMFVDITRDNMNELLEQVQRDYPNIVKVVISDYAHLILIINSIRKLNLHSFLLKPWKKQELLDTIESALDYARFMKLKDKEKENLEQKNVIYQRIINFKDDVGETNKTDINSLKTSLFILSSEYENLLKNLDGKNLELATRSLYNASEIYTSSFPSFVEKFKANDIISNINLNNVIFMDNTNDFEFIKNLTLVKEYASRTCKFLSNFMGASDEKITINKANEKDMELIIEANFNSTFKKELVLFFEYLKNVFNTESVKLQHEIYDSGALKIKITL